MISAICKPEHAETIKVVNGKINVKGKVQFLRFHLSLQH